MSRKNHGPRGDKPRKQNSKRSAPATVPIAQPALDELQPFEDMDATLKVRMELDECLMAIFETRSSTRERNLQAISGIFAKYFLPDYVNHKSETLVRALKTGLGTSNLEVVVNCLELLNIICVTVGVDGEEDLYATFKPLVVHLISDTESIRVRSLCCRTLALLCFILVDDEVENVECLEIFSKIIEDTPILDEEAGYYLHEVINAWSLLATTCSTDYMVETLIPSDVAVITDHISSRNITTRIAAGDALSLMCSVVAEYEEENHEVYSQYWFNGYLNVEDLHEILSAHAFDTQKKLSKAERSKQRKIFKNFLDVFENASPPMVEFTVQEQTLVFEEHSEVVRLDFFRRILQSGFLSHMESNPLLASIFDFVVEELMNKNVAKDMKIRAHDASVARKKHRDLSRNANRLAKDAFNTGY